MKAILVDDERLARKELAGLLSAYPDIDIVDECANVDEAKQSIRKHNPDVVFLDIQMPGKNGFELFTEISELPEVIFVTAYDEYAIRAFEVNALDYLLKPVHPARLEETIRKLMHQDEASVAAEPE